MKWLFVVVPTDFAIKHPVSLRYYTVAMYIGTLHTITGVLFVAALLCKIVTHFYVEQLQKHSMRFAAWLLFPKIYLLPYQKKVEQRFKRIKLWCNLLYITAVLALIANLIVGLLML